MIDIYPFVLFLSFSLVFLTFGVFDFVFVWFDYIAKLCYDYVASFHILDVC